MDFIGSGGIVLVVLAVLWLGFLTPSGQKGLQDRQPKQKRQRASIRTARTTRSSVSTPRYRVITGVQAPSAVEEQPAAKVVINRLPDPLSARLGTLENVKWAEVVPLEEVREEKEKISSETLDEILQRRRSNG